MTLVKRFGGLIVGLMALVTMWTFVSTDLVWQRMGRPSEEYPEFFYAAFGLPPAFIAVVAGLYITLSFRGTALTRRHKISYWVNGVALAFCALLIFDVVFFLR